MSQFLCSITNKLPVDPVIIDGAHYERNAVLEKLHETPEFFGYQVFTLDALKTDEAYLDEVERFVQKCNKPHVVKDWNKRRKLTVLHQKRNLRLFKEGTKKPKRKFLPLPKMYTSEIERVRLLLRIDPKGALDLFNKLLDGIENAKCYQLLGNIRLVLGDIDGAYTAYYKVLNDMPEDARKLNIYKNIADMYHNSKKYVKGLQWNTKALKQHGLKGKSEHYKKLAEAYSFGLGVEKNPASAEYFYKKSLLFDKSKNKGETNMEVSKLCFEQGKVSEMIRQISIAAKLDHPEAVDQESRIIALIDSVVRPPEQVMRTPLVFEC